VLSACLVRAVRCMLHGAVHAVRRVLCGAWYAVPAVRCMLCGACCAVHAVRCMLCGACCAVHAARCMLPVHAARCMLHGAVHARFWARQVIPARYYLYSFQDISAGPSIFQSIFQHILEYMKGDSPLEGLWMELRNPHKIAQKRGKSRKIARKMDPCSKEVLLLCNIDSI
jgi:hypothetical protein